MSPFLHICKWIMPTILYLGNELNCEFLEYFPDYLQKRNSFLSLVGFVSF